MIVRTIRFDDIVNPKPPAEPMDYECLDSILGKKDGNDIAANANGTDGKNE